MDDREYQVERLISRILDDEASPSERREFDGVARRDPHAAALFDETRSLDREIGMALRTAMRRSIPLRRTRNSASVVRMLGVAAAACLAIAAWKYPAFTPRDHRQTQQAGSSWFGSTSDAPGDQFDPRSRLYDAPTEQRRKVDSEWIVIPSETPGEFMVISVDKVKTRASSRQRGF